MTKNVIQVRNWKKIVSDLKSGPDFGIHGPRKNTLNSILNDKRSTINCHYFCVGENEKRMDDDEFYRRLFSSIYDGLKFSYKFEIKDREAIFDGNPSLIIGTNHARPVYGECSNLYGETFEVGYGLWRDFGIHGITMEKDEIEDAKKKMRKFAQELNHSIYERYELAFFIAGEVTRRFIPKIHKKLSQ